MVGVVVVLVEYVCEVGLVVIYVFLCWCYCGDVWIVVEVVVVVGKGYFVGWCDGVGCVVIEYVVFDWWCVGED